MNPKVVGEAPSMPMGVLYLTWRDYLKDVTTQERTSELFQDLLNLDRHGSPRSRGEDTMFASAPAESFDWGDGGGRGHSHGDAGGGKGHHGASHEGEGDASLTAALSLFKAFGHGDLDL